MTLRDLLARDPVCRDIVEYLMQNNDAADTARGIAQWWIRRDVAATQEALMKLQEWGVVQHISTFSRPPLGVLLSPRLL